jgi:peptide/nickel transport system permease protein
VIFEAAGPTLQLAGSAVAIALCIAVGIALATAGRRRGLAVAMSGIELILLSTPVYWIGIVLLSLFSFRLQWFPITGNDGLSALVLPAIALSLPLPFALTVRSRGVGERALRLRHGLRHAALAATTLTGTLLAGTLSGSILTETVFGRSGIGQVTLQAIKTRDMPLVLGLVMLSACLFVIVNLLVDALYMVIDPRLRRTVQ